MRNSEDIIWTIGFFVGLCISVISLFTFTLIIQHLHCIPESSFAADLHPRIEPEHAKAYSTLSVTFATLSVIATLSAYILCTQWPDWYSALARTAFILVLDSYVLSKLFLYLLFIGRLVNPYYQRIYQYPNYIRYLLWMLFCGLLASLIGFNIGWALMVSGIVTKESTDAIWLGIYAVTDSVLSIATMILFFRPICIGIQPTDHHQTSTDSDMSVVMTYGTMSALQLFAALSYEMSLLGRVYLASINAPRSVWDPYLNICSVISMLDCLLVMICIYFGFARKRTVCFLIL